MRALDYYLRCAADFLFGREIDLFTYNWRIAECLFKKVDKAKISSIGRDNSDKKTLFYFTGIKGDKERLNSLVSEIDLYVERLNKKMQESEIEEFGGYVIKNHRTGDTIRITRSTLEERSVSEIRE